MKSKLNVGDKVRVVGIEEYICTVVSVNIHESLPYIVQFQDSTGTLPCSEWELTLITPNTDENGK